MRQGRGYAQRARSKEARAENCLVAGYLRVLRGRGVLVGRATLAARSSSGGRALGSAADGLGVAIRRFVARRRVVALELASVRVRGLGSVDRGGALGRILVQGPELGEQHEADCSGGNNPSGNADQDHDCGGEVGESIAKDDEDDHNEDAVIDSEANEARFVELLGQIANAEGVIRADEQAEAEIAKGCPRGNAIGRVLLADHVGGGEIVGIIDGDGLNRAKANPERADDYLQEHERCHEQYELPESDGHNLERAKSKDAMQTPGLGKQRREDENKGEGGQPNSQRTRGLVRHANPGEHGAIANCRSKEHENEEFPGGGDEDG